MSKAETIDHGDPTDQAGGCLDSVTGVNRAQARGVRFGEPRKLTQHQRQEA